MQTFDCSDAHVTSVTIIDEPDLTLLDCYNNEIERTNLDISGALNLEILNCYNNPKLLFLNLSAHKKLTTLDCRHDKSDKSDPDDKGGITTIILPSEGSELENITAYKQYRFFGLSQFALHQLGRKCSDGHKCIEFNELAQTRYS